MLAVILTFLIALDSTTLVWVLGNQIMGAVGMAPMLLGANMATKATILVVTGATNLVKVAGIILMALVVSTINTATILAVTGATNLVKAVGIILMALVVSTINRAAVMMSVVIGIINQAMITVCPMVLVANRIHPIGSGIIRTSPPPITLILPVPSMANLMVVAKIVVFGKVVNYSA
jgi:hypothetical protein